MLNNWRAIVLFTCLFQGRCFADVGRLVCFYDANSFWREGPAQLTIRDLEPALNFCNYLIYGYAGVDATTAKILRLNLNQTTYQDQYFTITALKQKFPHIRILLSVGGDRDEDHEGNVHTIKYLNLLEQPAMRQNFKSSAIDEINRYGFDGLDLAWQFPKTMPRNQGGALKKAWHTVKGWFSSSSTDAQAVKHKQQFATLVRELNLALQQNGHFLTLTMMPHVDVAQYIDIEDVIQNVNFVNLGTYDFYTPKRNPKTADLPASLYALYDRDPSFNVHYHVEYWVNHITNTQKLNIGVTAYGRAWHMTTNSGLTGFPPVSSTEGAVKETKSGANGLLSWPEICELLNPPNKDASQGAHLRKVGDPTKRFGIYAYCSEEEPNASGIWIGYEDPSSAAIKAGYAQSRALGGVALFDLSLDDFRGHCAGEKYPILRSIKYKL